MLYKAILVAQASSGTMTTRLCRSSCSSALSVIIGPLIYRRREVQDVDRVLERHTVKVVAAFAVFIKDEPCRFKCVHLVGDVKVLVLAVIEIHTASIGEIFPRRLVIQVQGDGSSLNLLWWHVTSFPFA
jgi:hypothetical protein